MALTAGIRVFRIGYMAKTKQQKTAVVTELADRLQKATAVVFVSYHNVPVKEINQLRSSVRSAQGEYVVTKKTLLQRALASAGYAGVSTENFIGNVAVGLAYGDQVAIPKAIAEFVKKHAEQMTILGGVLERSVVDAIGIKYLATLPSREELLAKMVGTLQAPISGFVNVLAGNLRNLVGVLNAIKTAKS